MGRPGSVGRRHQLLLDDSDESVAAPDHRLDVARLVRVIVERPANLADRRIDAIRRLDMPAFPPYLLGDLLPGDDAVPLFESGAAECPRGCSRS